MDTSRVEWFESPMTDRYELVFCPDGVLELRDRNDPDCWIATDSPVELER